MRGPVPTSRRPRPRPSRRGPFEKGLATIAPLALALLSAAPALAQTFEKVDDSTRDQLPATPFVGAAYGFIWIAILAYVFFLARGLGGVKNQIADLQRRIDKATGGAAASGERNDAAATTTPGR